MIRRNVPTLILLAILQGSCVLADAPGAESQMACGMRLPSTADLKQTPRRDQHLERVALVLSDGLVAESAVYARLQKDVAAIQRLQPIIKSISYPSAQGTTLLISVAPGTRDDFLDRAPEKFRCLNRVLHAATPQPLSTNLLTVDFPGIYNIQRLSTLYQSIPGVVSAESGGAIGDGSTVSVTAEGDTWHYVFDSASGDCSAGCSKHHLFYTATTPDQKPKRVQEWISTSQGPLPDWATRYWRRRGG
jgi:hypothetical protein